MCKDCATLGHSLQPERKDLTTKIKRTKWMRDIGWDISKHGQNTLKTEFRCTRSTREAVECQNARTSAIEVNFFTPVF